MKLKRYSNAEEFLSDTEACLREHENANSRMPDVWTNFKVR